MFVVVDSNELFSLLIRGSQKSEAIFFSDDVELIAPKFLLEEFSNNKEEILSKTRRSEEEFARLFSIFKRRIKFFSKGEFEEFIPQALKLFPEHTKDAQHLALALKFSGMLWTEEKLLKRQSSIKVLNTLELFDLISV